MEELLGKNWVKSSWVLGIVLAIATISLAIAIGPMGIVAGLSAGAIVVGLGGVVLLSTWVAILIHELGHAAAAWLTGMKVYTISVMNRAVYSRPPHVKSEQQYGYVVGLDPEAKIWQLAIFVAAGPITSLAASVGTFFLARWAEGQRLSSESPGSLLVSILIICLYVLFLANFSGLLGLLTSHPYSDRALLIEMVREPVKVVQQHRKYACWIALEGYRPRDYPLELLDRLRELCPDEALIPFNDFSKSFDSGDITTAESHIRVAYQKVVDQGLTGDHAALIAFEMSIFAARFLNDSALSRQALNLGRKLNMKDPNRSIAIAARLYVRGRKELALKIAHSTMVPLIERQHRNSIYQEYARDWAIQVFSELANTLPNVGASTSANAIN